MLNLEYNTQQPHLLMAEYGRGVKKMIEYAFTITNIIGQAVYTHTLTDEEVKKGSFTIDLENIKLEKGIYLTKMSNNGSSTIQKLVIR